MWLGIWPEKRSNRVALLCCAVESDFLGLAFPSLHWDAIEHAVRASLRRLGLLMNGQAAPVMGRQSYPRVDRHGLSVLGGQGEPPPLALGPDSSWRSHCTRGCPGTVHTVPSRANRWYHRGLGAVPLACRGLGLEWGVQARGRRQVSRTSACGGLWERDWHFWSGARPCARRQGLLFAHQSPRPLARRGRGSTWGARAASSL